MAHETEDRAADPRGSGAGKRPSTWPTRMRTRWPAARRA